MRQEQPYNPLDKLNLGESIAEALLTRPVEKLPPTEIFSGAGIYALYYEGYFPLYERISEKNRKNQYGAPIYVGKAVPKGARKGGILGPYLGRALYKRLDEHAESIRQTTNLRVDDFCCRYLVVEDIWIPLGETLLIEQFSPLWNRYLDGFGNHDPGSGRYEGQRSLWDVIHPGRKWAEKQKPNTKTQEVIETELRKLLP